MARRLPKFPLEMANGEKVRNIEDLRVNVDIKSIVAYFLDGRLKRWCSAWRYDDLSDKLDNVTFEMIKSIYDVLDIAVEDSQIEDYLKENNTHMCGESVMDTENDDEIIDNEELKSKLKSYVDPDVNLSDFAIDLIPVNSKLTVIRILYKKNSCRYSFIFDAHLCTSADSIYINIALQLKSIHNLNRVPQTKKGKYF